MGGKGVHLSSPSCISLLFGVDDAPLPKGCLLWFADLKPV
jgi:hypothetical protein